MQEQKGDDLHLGLFSPHGRRPWVLQGLPVRQVEFRPQRKLEPRPQQVKVHQGWRVGIFGTVVKQGKADLSGVVRGEFLKDPHLKSKDG